MLNLLKKLSQLRSAVLIALILPLPFVLWNFGTLFNDLPSFPYSKFTITFKAPGMMANEIEKKVVVPAEKMFNGLPGLLLQESVVEHENANIYLEFLNDQDPERSLLFIQEKIDRLKISLPSNIEEILINLRKREQRADLIIQIPPGTLAFQWNTLLEELGAKLIRTSPYITDYQELSVKLDVARMSKNKVSLEQVGKALKVAGLTYRLGDENGVSYLLEGTYSSKADISNIIIGNRGHRPLRLADISNINLKLPPAPSKVNLWVDKQLYNIQDVKKIIESKLSGSIVTNPLLNDFNEFISPNLIIGLGILFFQMLIFFLTFRSKNAFFIILVFDLLWTGDYLFITWLRNGEITHFDFASMYLTNIIACFLLHFILCRIRAYFLPSKLDNFIQRDMQQAKFFSLVEYIPTFIFLYILFAVVSIPLLIGNLSLVSNVILKNVIFFSPLSIFLIIIMILFFPLEWIKEQNKIKAAFSVKSLIEKGKVWPIYPIFIIALSLPFIWNNFSLGISNGDLLKEWRGISDKLTFYKNINSDNKNTYDKLIVQDQISYGPIMMWNITPTGLSAIAKRDINAFQVTLQDLMQQRSVLIYEDIGNDIKVNYSRSINNIREFGELNIGGENVIPMPLRIFSNPKVKLVEKRIFRGQLNRQYKVNINDKLTDKNIFYKPKNQGLITSSKARYMFNEHEEYLSNHWTVLLFLFVLLSLFLNSFFRGALLSMFSMSIWKSHEMIGSLLHHSFNIDSLWSSALPLWVCLTTILLLSKVVDVERVRGNDKEKVLQDLGEKMSLSTIYGLLLFILCLAWWWIANHLISNNIFLNYSYELLNISITLFFVSILTYFVLFRLYYIESESILEDIRLKLYLWYYRNKNNQK
ncbi:MAG: hypothetical protein HN576_08380 [Bacteriovoracaceae bacterium]|jgi:hypothetical protein|nr:hypothetical protein [Bacteriovoracaceae bacterium]